MPAKQLPYAGQVNWAGQLNQAIEKRDEDVETRLTRKLQDDLTDLEARLPFIIATEVETPARAAARDYLDEAPIVRRRGAIPFSGDLNGLANVDDIGVYYASSAAGNVPLGAGAGVCEVLIEASEGDARGLQRYTGAGSRVWVRSGRNSSASPFAWDEWFELSAAAPAHVVLDPGAPIPEGTPPGTLVLERVPE